MKSTPKVSTAQVRPINEEKVQAAHARAVQKEQEYQKRMRRAFNAWDKIRQTVDRYDRQLEKAAAERFAKALPPRKVKLKKGATALPQLDDLLSPSQLKAILP